MDPANEIAFGLALGKLWGVHLNEQNGLKYDQDKARRFDYEFQKQCVEARDYERLEMYVIELLMTGQASDRTR